MMSHMPIDNRVTGVELEPALPHQGSLSEVPHRGLEGLCCYLGLSARALLLSVPDAGAA